MEDAIDSDESVELHFRWTRPLILKLITLLRKSENENIYNTKHQNYANRRKRTETILKMLAELREMDANVTMDGLRTKIRGIRAQYVQEFRRVQSIRTTAEGDEICVPTLWFFDEMAPLHSYFNTKPPESTHQENNNSYKNRRVEELDVEEDSEQINRKRTIFSRPMFSKLICLLRENEIMYNLKHPHYGNKEKRFAVLQKMCTELRKMNESVTIEAIKVKIAGLRKQYLNEQRRINSSKPNAAEEFPRLWCYHQLEFLKDHFKAATDGAEDSDSSLEEVFIEFGEPIESTPENQQICDEAQLCRLCANLTNLTNLGNLFEENHQYLLELIEELTGLQLSNTKNLPKYVCKTCEEETLQAHQFRERCIESQERLASTKYDNQKELLLSELHVAADEEVGFEYEAVEDDDDNDRMLPFYEISIKQEEDEKVKNENKDSTDDFSSDYNNSESVVDDDMQVLIQSDANFAKIEADQADDSEEISAAEMPAKRIKEETKKLVGNRKPVPNKKSCRKPKKKYALICDQCGKHFKHRSGLNVHVRRHLGVKEFQCEFCEKEFYIKSEMQLHRRVHTGETPYQCEYCELRFKSCTKRLMHERQYHTKVRPFPCVQCDQRFTNSSALKAHQRRHDGIRSYECSVCNVSFVEKKHLRVHCRSSTHRKREERQQYL